MPSQSEQLPTYKMKLGEAPTALIHHNFDLKKEAYSDSY